MPKANDFAENAKAIASRRERVLDREERKEARRGQGMKRREADIREETEVKPSLESSKKLRSARKAMAWAEAKVEALGYDHTVPRDYYERGVLTWDAPEETKEHIHVFFDSELREQRNPVLPTFDANLYEPLTKDLAEDLGIKVPYGRWTETGHMKVGHDAIVKIAPKKIMDARRKDLSSRHKIAERMRKHEEFYREQALSVNRKGRNGEATMPIGDIQIGSYENQDDFVKASEGRGVEGMKLSGLEEYLPPDQQTIEEEQSDE